MTMVADTNIPPVESEPGFRPGSSSRGPATAPVGQGRRFAAPVVVLSDTDGASAEGIRTLRTHIMAQHIDRGRRALAICAASPGVGATFVATNLAVSLAQIGVRTLLIDANLRHPGVDKLISGQESSKGLMDWLKASDLDLREAIDADVIPNLSVIHAGGVAANPQELLAGERFKSLMEACLRDFDITIIDTPPANSCSDAGCVSAVAGYSLIVARRDKSFVGDLKILISQLRSDNARIVGTVLNGA